MSVRIFPECSVYSEANLVSTVTPKLVKLNDIFILYKHGLRQT